mmetsp:Transcript_9270/g.13875  ORF Transcript_9270/g.13875 Transcript_9270/m.13875 type:complete len:81 (+) Transcript_9270:2354-2596(+)
MRRSSSLGGSLMPMESASVALEGALITLREGPFLVVVAKPTELSAEDQPETPPVAAAFFLEDVDDCLEEINSFSELCKEG